jgi:TonB family protein
VTGSDLKKGIEAIMGNEAREVVSLWNKALLGAAIMLAAIVPVSVGVLHVPQLQAQSSTIVASRPAFEVASIRPQTTGDSKTTRQSQPGGQFVSTLSTGGTGSGLQIDAPNFCCPDYLVDMLDRIRTNWVQQAEVAGTNVVKFTIQRDGRVLDVVLEQSSGRQNLDMASRRALLVTKTLNRLPATFPNPTLTVHLNFQYRR